MLEFVHTYRKELLKIVEVYSGNCGLMPSAKSIDPGQPAQTTVRKLHKSFCLNFLTFNFILAGLYVGRPESRIGKFSACKSTILSHDLVIC